MSGPGDAPVRGAVALVTGGTRGIGLAAAQALAAGGARVYVAARRPPAAPLDGLRFIAADVADAASVGALFAAIAGEAGRLTALVNAAGQAGSNPLDPAGDDALWHAIIASNLTGSYLCAKAALPLMEDGAGAIVNIASVLGLKGVPDQTAYCAAKHGVIGLTRSLALAVAPRRITVNAVCPGWVATDMAAQRFRELGIDAQAAAAGVPLGAIAAPRDVAGAICFLLGPGARHITGQTLVVDGGALA